MVSSGRWGYLNTREKLEVKCPKCGSDNIDACVPRCDVASWVSVAIFCCHCGKYSYVESESGKKAEVA